MNVFICSNTCLDPGFVVNDRPSVQVALQFPDSMLHDAVAVQRALRHHLLSAGCSPAPRLAILGDTSYGSTCVDEVAAQHINAQMVIHYGPANLLPYVSLCVDTLFLQQASMHLRACGFFVYECMCVLKSHGSVFLFPRPGCLVLILVMNTCLPTLRRLFFCDPQPTVGPLDFL